MSAGGKEVGRVSIRVVPNVDNFKDDVEREVARIGDVHIDGKVDLDTEKAKADAEKLEKTTHPKIKADLDTDELRAKLRAVTQSLKDTVKVAARLDTSQLKAELAKLKVASSDLVPVDLRARIVGLQEELARAKLAASRHLGNIKIGVQATSFYAHVARVAARGREIVEDTFRLVTIPVMLASVPLIWSAQKAKAGVEAVFKGLKVTVGWAGDKVMAAARATRAKLSGMFRGVKVVARWAGQPLVAAATATRARLGKIFSTIKQDVHLVTAPLIGAAKSAHAAVKRIFSRVDAKITAKLNLDEAGFIAKTRAVAKAASAGLKVHAKMDIDQKQVAAVMAGVGKSARFLSRPIYKVFGAQVMEDIVRNFTRMKGVIASMTLAASAAAVPLAAIGTAAGKSAVAMAKLVAGMAPAAFGAAALGIAGLAKAFSGFGNVVKASSIDDLNEAVAGMGPAAQEAARGIYEVKSAFSEASAGAQEAFWGAITSDIAGLAPMAAKAGDAVTQISKEAGNAANSMVEFFNSSAGFEMFSSLVDSSAEAAASISKAIFGIVPGLTAVGAAAGPVFAGLTKQMEGAFTGWSDKMVAQFQSGELQAVIQQQVAVAKEFGSVMGDLGGIIGGVWSAAAASGQQFLSPLKEAVSATNEWVHSADGMSTIQGYFDSMGSIVSDIAPIIGEIATTILGSVIPAIADFVDAAAPGMQQFAQGFSDLIQQLAPFASQIGSVVGEVLGYIGEILPSLAPLVPAIMGVAAAFEGWKLFGGFISPLIGILGGLSGPMILVVGAAVGLAAALMHVPGAAQALGGAFQGLMGALQPVWQLIVQFAQQLWSALQPAFAALVPVVVQFITTLGQIITALTPVIGAVLNFAVSLINALVPVFVALMPVIQAFISIVGSIVTALAPVLTVVLQVAGAFLSLLGHILGFVASALASILSFVAGVIAGFASMVATVVSTVVGWVSSILSFFGSLASGAISTATSMWTSVVSAFSSGVSRAISWVSRMPGMAKAALGNVGSILVASGRALIQGFVDGIMSMVGAVANAAHSVVSAARSFFPFSPAKEGPFSGHGYTLYSGQALTKDFAAGMVSQIGDVKSAAESVTEAANKPFEDLARNKILRPVLESNAQKIADSHKKEEQAEEEHNKRLEEIRRNGGKNVAASLAEEDQKYAEKLAKIREDLDKSLEAPDYSKIDRSFNSFYIGGAKELLKQQLMQVVTSQELATKTREGTLEMLSQARQVIGDNPLLADVELNVKSDHFEWAFNKAIEDSDISAVPVEFVISNLDQLKKDLGMGDGVVSRAIDQAREWNWNNTDASKYREAQKKTEVHYHVEDMQEAIRRENLRVRKQMMKMS